MTEQTAQPKKIEIPERDAPGEKLPYVDDGGPEVLTEKVPQERQRTPNSSYQSYLFGNAGAGDTPAWSDSAKGRFAIRMISRGIVGSTFFVIGSRMANHQLRGYNEKDWKFAWDKPLQAVAKGFDVTFGRGIKKSVEMLARVKHTPQQAAKIGQQAVTFRESREFPGSGLPMGRSYGADVVGFTFDFAMASIGDASTRNIIQAFDPNIKKTWRVNDEGNPAAKGEKWHFLPGEWLKSTLKTSWRVFSKNQGEDWAAAIPYAFQMKFQRQFLSNIFSKRWDGHQLVFDHSWNGGAYRVDQKGKIVGDYQLVGALDLHARFVGYNWYTLMFREGYDRIGNAFHRWKDDGFQIHMPQLPQHFNPITSAVDTVGDAARYVTKSFIKANMYMNPAVVPFWLIRVPQSKWRGREFVSGNPRKLGVDANLGKEGGLQPYAWSNYDHYPDVTTLDKVEKGLGKYLFNPIGWVSHKAGTGAATLSDRILGKTWEPKSRFWHNILSEKDLGIHGGRRKFVHEVVDASLSYTPYMYAKQEFGLRVDDTRGDDKLGQMDVAIYKFMDDVAGFKFREVPDDLKRMWKLGTNFEREVKAREGGGSDAQEITKAPQKPATTVHASGLERHDPTPLQRADLAVNDAQYEGRWAQMVAGSDINPARIHPASATRH